MKKGVFNSKVCGRFLVLMLALTTVFSGCSRTGINTDTDNSSAGSESSDLSTTDAPIEYKETTLSHTEFENVAIHGRSLHVENGYRMEWPYSGFTIRGYFKDSFSIGVADADGYSTTASLTITVDGEIERKTVAKGLNTVTLAVLDEGYHEITVRKGAEITAFRFTLTEMTFTGSLLPVEEPKLRIEFIGDSITNGVGALNENGKLSYPREANCHSSYSGKTAAKLGAEANIIAVSGWGISKGSVSMTDVIPSIYKSYSPFEGSGSDWDFSAFCPDVIVLALGANDAGANIYKFRAESVAFLQQIRACNPDVPIIWMYGMIGNSLGDAVKQAITESGLDGVTYLEVPMNNSGTDGHPTEKAQDEYTDLLVEAIKSAVGEQA